MLRETDKLLFRKSHFGYSVQFGLSTLPAPLRSGRRDRAVLRRHQTPSPLVDRVGRHLSIFQRTAFGSRSTGFVSCLPQNQPPSFIYFD